MGRSKSPSHSSRSNSRSRSSSRSRSPSRKKRYRSRSRTYSRSRSRERRDFRRDYRNNRGVRRPYGFRGRTRGYYQGGGRYYRGGYRPMWNRRYSRSPRRGRSRSRSPKRRSASSPRSRSRSGHSYKSSPSPRSSSSRSSSKHSKSPVIKIHTTQDKPGQKTEDYNKSESPANKSCDEQKDAFDPSEPLDELGKELDLHGDTWAGLSAYDNSPRSPCSPSPVTSPPSHSSSHSACPVMNVVRCAKDTLSENIHSIVHSPEISGSGGNGLKRYSPSQNSPLQMSTCKSPAKSVLIQNPLEESHYHYSFYADTTKEHANNTKFFDRYTDEENKLFPIEKCINKEKGTCKERGTEKTKKGSSNVWDEHVALDYFLEKEPGNSQFLANSNSEDLEEAEDYRQFRKSVLADQGKSLSSVSNWNCEEEDSKYKTKGLTRFSKEGEKFKVVRGSKSAEQVAKEKHKDKVTQRHSVMKDLLSSDELKIEKTKDLFSYNLTLHESNVIEKNIFREESPVKMRIVATESPLPEVKLRIITVPLDDGRAPCLDNERLLGSTLIHSVKKVQAFRTIFDHLKVPFTSRTSPESFMYHVVSLVHHVKEHYFKGCGKTLNERFTDCLKDTLDHVSHLRRPEIHRVIDIPPNIPKKHIRIQDEDKAIKKETAKVEKKKKSSLSDQRCDVQHKKEHSKERVDLTCSRESSNSQKKEKPQKELKEFKIFKEESKRKKDLGPPHSPSSGSSHEEKYLKKESEEMFKDPPEAKEYSGFAGIGRTRGTLQFRIRGRARARGVFAGACTGTVNTTTTFQKRPKEEEWDPEYTPKSKKYFLHDDRDDGVDYWAKRGRSRGNFQRGRSRFPFKKSGTSPKWTHDKYQGDDLLEDEEEIMEERNKEEKLVENTWTATHF
ncbi:bcl-2-associated transcription factor 1 isoform X3 [Xenopus tropicalis]|uniref:Bcl-2-associated transcription factor 1 isoform X3 n=1 Tax=Xenopus tropicalis TaxID=8364 RepID=A0A8J0T3X9_XENTR|nr:bcl-2-associated transcription factor 1 isoform X3 [Xenopus tropicalis]|eukprot:XP_017949263.1 PREDICTED: bcl-2-associated transcription factor 1 isoform X3 [Xenopus tropicalis]